MHKTSIFVKRSIAFETNWCKTLHTTYFSFFFVSLSQTLEYLEYKHWQWYISKPFKVLKSLRNFYTSFSLVKSQLRFNNKEAILKPKIVPKNIFDISPSKFIICLYFSKTHFFQASVVLYAVWALTSTKYCCCYKYICGGHWPESSALANAATFAWKHCQWHCLQKNFA